MILLIDTIKEKLGKTSLGRLEDTVKRYAAVANEWGCKKPVDYKPWK